LRDTEADHGEDDSDGRAGARGTFPQARDEENLVRSLGAHEYMDSDASDPAKAQLAIGDAKAIIATVTNAEALGGHCRRIGCEWSHDGSSEQW
jgi:hypothetical protein